MAITLYGIPNCGTVKKAKAALEDAGLSYSFVDFRASAPTARQIKTWVSAFGAKALRNTSGGSYRALGEEKASWTDAQWSAAFANDAMLIKRPIIEKDGVPIAVGFQVPADILKQLKSR